MKNALDAARWIVVPKALRQALGLKPGQALEIRAGGAAYDALLPPPPPRMAQSWFPATAVHRRSMSATAYACA